MTLRLDLQPALLRDGEAGGANACLQLDQDWCGLKVETIPMPSRMVRI